MSDAAEQLKAFEPTQEFFVGIDSDGCVFDSMEIKHKECFTPMFIKHFGLQTVSKYAREVWEFVNLYSKTRGINRFQRFNALHFLKDRHEVQARHVQIPETDALEEWMARKPSWAMPLSRLRWPLEMRPLRISLNGPRPSMLR